MANAREVGELFNEKAATWRAKYRAGGPLERRLDAFEAALAGALRAPSDLLDFGCGTGDLAARFASRGHRVVASDIAERMLAEARRAHGDESIRWTKLDPTSDKLPFDDASFDAVVASSVLEYVDRVAPILREFQRILRPAGRLAFTVPNPGAPVRRLEALARPLAKASRLVPMPRRLARVDRYAQYLVASKNRMDVAGWSRALRDAGLVPSKEGVRPRGAFSSSRAPLMLLAFERPAG